MRRAGHAAALAAGLLLLTAPAGAADEAKEGLPGDWLTRYASARAMGRGGAFMALGDEPVGALWNPAGASWLSRGEIQAGSTRLFEDTSINGLGLALPSNRLPSLAVNILHLKSGEFERTNELNEVQGTFDEGDLVVGLAAAHQLSRRWSLGAGVRVVRQTIEEFSGSGMGLDFGVMGELPGGVRVGAAAVNVGGPAITLRDKEETYLQELRGGVAVPLLAGAGLVAVDVVQRDGPGTHMRAGARFSLQALDLRVGWCIEDVTAGFSYNLPSGVTFDYAMADHELGMTHRFGVTYRFGGFYADSRAEPAVFSPTGLNPVTKILLLARTRADAADWRLDIVDKGGLTVRSYAGQGQPPAHIVWDGKDASGLPLPDGAYTYTLQVTDAEGRVFTGRERAVEISTGGPSGTVEVER